METNRFTIFGLFLLIGMAVFSQVSVIPQGFNYQAIARDSIGSPRTNQQINLRFTITNQTGTNIPYIETHTKTTDQFGLFTTVIGQGLQTGGTGAFSQIDWKAYNYYIKIEIQEGTNYFVIGTEPLLSVPYAMYAQRASYADHADTSNTNELQNLLLTGNNLSISNGNTIDISTIIPTGSIMPFVGTTVPNGWLLCDGSLFLTTQYPNLYSSIGISFGGTLGANFNVPDFRGKFLRGVTGTTTNDPDVNSRTANGNGQKNAVGSIQDDAFQGHYHNFRNPSGNEVASVSYVGGVGGLSGITAGTSGTGTSFAIKNPITNGTNGTPRISSETRPKNIYVNYIIKY